MVVVMSTPGDVLDSLKKQINIHPKMWLAIRVVLSMAIAVGLLFGTSRLFVRHPNWQPYLRDLPDIAAYALAALGAALPFLPELLKMLEDKKSSRWFFAAICMALAIFAIASNHAQRVWDEKDKEAAGQQLTQILNNGATHGDIKMLDQHMADGFAGVIAAIKNQPIKPPEKVHPLEVPLPAPPHVSFAQERAVPTEPFLYALRVIIQSDATIPASFQIECNGKVENVNAFLVGKGAYMDFRVGLSADSNGAIVHIGFPPLSPESPLVVTLQSNSDIRVKEIKPF
jgi:hypothetical protein